MKYFLCVLFFIGTTGCATVGEVLYEGSASTDYTKTTDNEGHTKYVRHRIVSDGTGTALTPISPPTTPVVTIEPPTSDSAPVTQIQNSSSNQDSLRSVAFVISVSANENTFNGDLSGEWVGDFISGDIGIAMVSSDRTYFGFSGQVRAHFPWTLSPYAGVGLYGGDSKTCTYQPIGGGYSEEVCEKYYLFSTTAELGAQYFFNDHVQLRLFGRTFSQTRQGDPLRSLLYGAAVAFYF